MASVAMPIYHDSCYYSENSCKKTVNMDDSYILTVKLHLEIH